MSFPTISPNTRSRLRRLSGVVFFASLTLVASAGVVVDQALVPTDKTLSKKSSSYLLKGGDDGPLEGFDPGDSDKLVVVCSSEGYNPVAVTAVTYGGRALREAVDANSSAERHHAAIYYLDGPPASGDLRVDFGDGPRIALAVSLLALSGTADGVGVTGAAIGENSASLTTSPLGSLVLFANVFNGGKGSQPPKSLTPLVDAESGSASHGSGYQLVEKSGEVVARFDDAPVGQDTVTLAADFPAATRDEIAAVPNGKPIRQSHDWGQPLEGFNDHAYLSQVGQPSAAPDSPSETWVQYLSGTDKDDTVEWDFYCTYWGKMRQWSRLPVPSCWEMHGFGKFTYYDAKSGEKGSYNYRFRVPKEWENRRHVSLVFEGVSLETHAYVNGKPVAKEPHSGSYTRFSYDVTDMLDYDGINLLEVHVDNDSSLFENLVAAEGGDYWRFGGVYRPVYLQAQPIEFIERCAIDARADGTLNADVYLQGIQHSDRVTARVTTLDGKILGGLLTARITAGQDKVRLTGKFENPLLWSAETPNLYRLEIVLSGATKTIHTTSERFGFRTVEVRPGEGFFVNGVKVIIKGVNRHSTWPDSGKTLSDEVHELDIQRMKEMNMNAVRTCHYPPDVRFLDLCDEKGIYVLNEFASCQNKIETEIGKPLARAFVKRDVNHPSVIFWANGNEGGHNPEIDPFLKEFDIQKRPVIYPRHGREPVDGIITDHYEPYVGIQQIIDEKKIYIATELAHGLYDGGGGAGFEDRWRLMMSATLTQGCFVWNLMDEGIRRPDRNGQLDVSGNQAPDGMTNPYRKPEGSFYTLKEIFCPIHISMRELPDGFNGRVEIENRYNFTNTDHCAFAWKLVRFSQPGADQPGHVVSDQGRPKAPSIAPGTNPDFHRAWLDLKLPKDWRDNDALLLTATDPDGRELWTWSWSIKSASDQRKKIVTAGKGQTGSRTGNDRLVLTAADLEVEFNTSNGMLSRVVQNGSVIPLSNGPNLCTGNQQMKSFRHHQQGDKQVVEVVYNGNMKSATWTLFPSGWLQLDYHYHLTGKVPFMGISFDYPESTVKSMTWLGRGPFRVWKNRLKGGSWNVWHKSYNQTATGDPESKDPYESPEFKGYHADVHWVMLHTEKGDITVVSEHESLFFRNFSADYPSKGSRGTAPPFPKGHLSFLDGIAPQGNKISVVDAPKMGPQGEPNEAQGDYRRTLYFHFKIVL
jgi:hypothetical protein